MHINYPSWEDSSVINCRLEFRPRSVLKKMWCGVGTYIINLRLICGNDRVDGEYKSPAVKKVEGSGAIND